jgi:hypothetical protein
MLTIMKHFIEIKKITTKKDFLELINKELSAFLKICPICEKKFKDTLYKRTMCIICERNQKIDELINKEVPPM